MKRAQSTSQNWKTATHRLFLLALCMMANAALLHAQTTTRATGEMTAARAASINGVAVRSSGITVFSNSKILTGERGSAAISLGKRGRVELGAKTNLALQFGSGLVGGELQAGRLVVSVPAGVAIALNTAKGLVKSDGLQPTVLTVESLSEKTKVIAHLGEAKLTINGKTENVLSGEEVVMGSQGREGLQRRRLIAASLAGASGAVGATAATQAASGAVAPAALSTKTAVSFSSLVNTGLNFSLNQLFRPTRDPEQFFDTSVTCRDADSFFCRRRSSTTP